MGGNLKRILKMFMNWMIDEEDFVSDIKRNYSWYDKTMNAKR